MEDAPNPPRLPVVGSKDAPIIHVDSVSTFGIINGNATIALVAETIIPSHDRPGPELVCVAHLKLPEAALLSLKDAIEKVLLMARPPAGAAH